MVNKKIMLVVLAIMAVALAAVIVPLSTSDNASISGADDEGTVSVDSEYYATGSFVYIVDSHTPLSEDYELSWSYGEGDMIYSPAIIGDYVYAKQGANIIKVDINTGKLVNQATSIAGTGFYKYLTVGNGLIFDSLAGMVFDQDLNQVFAIEKTTAKAYYNDKVFYVQQTGHIYAYSAIDEDSSSPTNSQTLLWDTPSDVLVTPYEGGSTMLFADDYFVVTGLSGDDRYLLSYDIATGALIDSVTLTEMEGLITGKGYIFMANGVVYITAYKTGLFQTEGTDPIPYLASVSIDADGKFDDGTLKFYMSEYGDGMNTTFIVNGDYGYVHNSHMMVVYKLDTMEIVATATGHLYTHGSMAISTGYPGKTMIYLLPYDQNTDQVLVYEHSFDTPDVLTRTAYQNIISKDYCSQQAHFGSDGQMVFMNDSGKLFCISAVSNGEGGNSDNTLMYVAIAIVIIVILVALAYYFLVVRKKN